MSAKRRMPGVLAWCVFISACMILVGLPAAGAQEKYPSRPIDFIVTWGAGGGADAMARTIGQHAQPILGVAIPVSNVPGASGNTGLGQLMAAKADGYTIATYIMDTLATIPMGLSKVTVDDLEWVTRTQVADSFFLVKSDSPYKTIQELLQAAKENPGKIRVAADFLDDLKAGQLRPLIIFADKRHPAFPDVPASVELGYDIQLPQFRSIVAKKRGPAERVKILADAIRKGMETPAYKKFAAEWYFRPDSYMGPEQFGPWVREQVQILDRYVKEFGLKR